MEEIQSRIDGRFRVALGAFMVLLVLAVLPYTNDPAGDIKRYVLVFAACALGIARLWVTYHYNFEVRRPRLFLPLMLVFLALYVVATLRSPFFGVSLRELSQFLALFVLYLLASQVFYTGRQVRYFAVAVCGGVMFAAAYGLCQAIGFDPFPWAGRTSDVYAGLPSTFGHPNYAAHTLVLTVILGLYIGLCGIRLGFVFFLVSGLYLSYTGQRAGLVALAAAMFLYMLSRSVAVVVRKPGTAIFVTIALLGVLMTAAIAAVMLWTKAKSGTPFPIDAPLLLRYQSYVSAVTMLLDRPLLGFGPGVYSIVYPEYWTLSEKQWFIEQHAMNQHVHNDLMELSIDAGLLAGGAYLGMLVLGMIYGLFAAYGPGSGARRALGYTFAAICCAFLVDGLFGFNLRVPVSAALLFLLFGAFEGFWQGTPEAPKAAGHHAWRKRAAIAGTLALFALLLFETTVFAAAVFEYRGMAAHYKLDATRARQDFAAAERLAPWHWQYPRRIAQIDLLEGRHTEALTGFDRSLQQNPFYISTLLGRAHAGMALAETEINSSGMDALAARGLLDDSVTHLRRILDLVPEYSPAEELLGRSAYLRAVLAGTDAELAKQAWNDAAAYFESAIQHEAPNRGELYLLLASVREALGDDDGTEEALTRAAQEEMPDSVVWDRFRAFAQRTGRYDLYRNALLTRKGRLKRASRPDNTQIAVTSVWLAQAQEEGYKNPGAALDAYVEAVMLAPQVQPLWTAFARFAANTGNVATLEKAVVESCEQLRHESQVPHAALSSVDQVLRNGDSALDDACAAILEQIRLYPQDAPVSAVEDYGWAAEILMEKVLAVPEISNEICHALRDSAIIMAYVDDYSNADTLFPRAKECLREDELPNLHIEWASALASSERGAAAIEMLEAARQRFPDNLEIWGSLAQVLGREGRTAEAREAYQRILAEATLDETLRTHFEKALNALQ